MRDKECWPKYFDLKHSVYFAHSNKESKQRHCHEVVKQSSSPLNERQISKCRNCAIICFNYPSVLVFTFFKLWYFPCVFYRHKLLGLSSFLSLLVWKKVGFQRGGWSVWVWLDRAEVASVRVPPYLLQLISYEVSLTQLTLNCQPLLFHEAQKWRVY